MGRVVREGTYCTVVAYGPMVTGCEKAAEAAEKLCRSVESIDPRSLVPRDEARILASGKESGRCAVVY